MRHFGADDPGRLGVPPASVLYTCVLLGVQAGFWVIAALGVLTVWAENAHWNYAGRGSAHAAWFVMAGILVFVLTVGMAAGSAFLAARLRQATTGIWITAVVLEIVMTCFGMLIAYAAASAGAGMPAAGPVLAGLGGAAMSLAAVIGLLGKPARRFTAPPVSGS